MSLVGLRDHELLRSCDFWFPFQVLHVAKDENLKVIKLSILPIFISFLFFFILDHQAAEFPQGTVLPSLPADSLGPSS